MNILIGDIGNTNTKICLVESNTLKIKKIIYFSSSNIFSKNFLKKTAKKIFRKHHINKTALFSSVVPIYESILKNFFKKCNIRVKVFYCN